MERERGKKFPTLRLVLPKLGSYPNPFFSSVENAARLLSIQ